MQRFLLVVALAACGGAPKSGATSATADAIARGRAVVDNKGCQVCHTVDGSQRVGPTWKGLWNSDVELADGKRLHVDAAYLRRSIITPLADIVVGFPPTMPSFEGQLKDSELDDVIAYIQSLR